jgi:Protein of unknown function (DUF4232)
MSSWLAPPGQPCPQALRPSRWEACGPHRPRGINAAITARRPAGRDTAFRPRLVILRRGETAHALLTITEAGNFPARQCRVRTAVALRVIPRSGAHPAFVPLSFPACSRKGPIYLHIRVVRPGVGIPGVSQ